MEKIYMEEEQRKQQNKQQKKSVWDVSVVLSFVVAAFALVSLVAFGMSNIQGTGVSYAAPAGLTGDTFDFHKVGRVDGRAAGSGGDSSTTFPVSLLASDENGANPVFCIEHTIPIPDTVVQYKKYQDIDDYGFLYILNNSMVNGKKILNGVEIDAAYEKYVEVWATQVAIWLYQNAKNPGVAAHALTETEINNIKNATVFDIAGPDGSSVGSVSATGVYAKIESLVKSADEASSSRLLAVTKADGEISKTDDGKFYQSPIISVVGTPADFLQSYDISLSGVEGAIVVDENGNPISSMTGVPKTTKFYVRVPVDKVTQSVQELKVNVTGHFDTLAGSFYEIADSSQGAKQRVVSVTGATKNIAEGVSIEFVGAPDTGMNKAQTVYFVGLIVLLCGVGIVYANAKPVKNKQ